MKTKEQLDIINCMLSDESNDKIVAVNAVAGSGKSTVSKWIVEELNPNSGIYTAFNKAIVQDGVNKLQNSNVEAKTLHALAYKYIQPSTTIEPFSYSSIEENISYYTKKMVIDTLDNFYRSKHVSLVRYFNAENINNNLYNLVEKYYNKMLKEKISITFNFLLKKLHLLLLKKDITIKVDLLILDEFQDTTEVALEIFKLIESKKKIVLGDKYQNIYDFMNTVNGFDLLNDTINFDLTTSFRCTHKIANIVEEFGIKYLNSNFKFNGTDIKDFNNSTVYLSAYNSSGLITANTLLKSKTSFSLLKDTKELFSLPITLSNVKNNKSIADKRFNYLEKEWTKWNKYFKNTYSFETYLCTLKIPEVKSCINLLNYFDSNSINLFELKKRLDDHPTNINKIISTIHSFKGLEMDTVILNNDIKVLLEDTILEERMANSRSIAMQQVYNLYYVALTRAKHNIIYDKVYY